MSHNIKVTSQFQQYSGSLSEKTQKSQALILRTHFFPLLWYTTTVGKARERFFSLGAASESWTQGQQPCMGMAAANCSRWLHLIFCHEIRWNLTYQRPPNN